MMKMNLSARNGLKAAFNALPSAGLQQVLVYGSNAMLHTTFCKAINIARAAPKFLACSHVDIFAVSYYPVQAQHFVAWLKDKIPKPPCAVWWSLADAPMWLRLNIARELYIIHLALVDIEYYILIPFEIVRVYRSIAFAHER